MKAVSTMKGEVVIADIPEPELLAGHVRIRTEYSAISPGTEISIIRIGSEHPAILGYSAVGIVEEVGEGVNGLTIGQRAACYGAPYVGHKQIITVPANLVSAVPDHVRPEEAAFVGLGAIAIHALRTADLRFGESVIVVGLGILGNLIAQIASAAAFRTAGLDVNTGRAESLKTLGIPHVYDNRGRLEEGLAEFTGGAGADSVILCAGGPGEELINRSLEWLRDRGTIVVVGDLTTSFSRGAMFAKEAKVLISRAGGPGRYDVQYELENKDYPVGYVRWTEGRNVAEYIRLLAQGLISVSPLITDIVPFEHAAEAFDRYAKTSATIGTLLRWQ